MLPKARPDVGQLRPRRSAVAEWTRWIPGGLAEPVGLAPHRLSWLCSWGGGRGSWRGWRHQPRVPQGLFWSSRRKPALLGTGVTSRAASKMLRNGFFRHLPGRVNRDAEFRGEGAAGSFQPQSSIPGGEAVMGTRRGHERTYPTAGGTRRDIPWRTWTHGPHCRGGRSRSCVSSARLVFRCEAGAAPASGQGQRACPWRGGGKGRKLNHFCFFIYLILFW